MAHSRPVRTLCALFVLCLSIAGLQAQENAAEEGAIVQAVELSVTPTEATIGEHLQLLIRVILANEVTFEMPVIGPNLGDFEVVSGNWTESPGATAGQEWLWSGTLAIFETGDFEVPPLSVNVSGPNGNEQIESDPVTVTIRPILDQDALASGEVELVEIKPPASIAANYRPLFVALGLLGLLLVLALIAWWVHRRYAARLAAVDSPHDPFRRTPPHVWVYAELQKLLEKRLPEQGQVELFYGELSHILKQYLSGRYRIKLMETTTAEVPHSLTQVGVQEASIVATRTVLEGADHVKFAGHKPEPAEWKTVIEEIYRIVDTTKPVDIGQASAAEGIS